ncbi:hypothetical protein H8356DRAFT_1358715 [Neocallimastix lanati (nom. inval.)]|nr:hypothetical protein H8356DRAFT_1358715 [Neocallimastix sp. JGI-2020a]
MAIRFYPGNSRTICLLPRNQNLSFKDYILVHEGILQFYTIPTTNIDSKVDMYLYMEYNPKVKCTNEIKYGINYAMITTKPKEYSSREISDAINNPTTAVNCSSIYIRNTMTLILKIIKIHRDHFIIGINDNINNYDINNDDINNEYVSKTDNIIKFSLLSKAEKPSYSSNKTKNIDDFSKILFSEIINNPDKTISKMMKKHYYKEINKGINNHHKYVFAQYNHFTLRYCE